MFRYFKNIINKLKVSYSEIDAESFERRMNENTILLDVRSRYEFEMLKIPNALNLDVTSFNFIEEVKKLDKSKQLFIYCKCGRKGKRASKMLSNKGFNQIVNLKGGILAWSKYNESLIEL